MASRSPIRVSRRRLLMASGATLAAGAPAVLAACGTTEDDELSPAEEAEALNAVLAQQLAVIEAVDPASSLAPRSVQPAFDRLNTIRQASVRALENAITEMEGTPTSDPAPQAAQAESAVEGVARQLEASIAGCLEVVGDISPERRPPVQRAITEDAAALAAARAALGEEIAPDAFVFGPPIVAGES